MSHPSGWRFPEEQRRSYPYPYHLSSPAVLCRQFRSMPMTSWVFLSTFYRPQSMLDPPTRSRVRGQRGSTSGPPSGHGIQEVEYTHCTFSVLPWRQCPMHSSQSLRGLQRTDPKCHSMNPFVSLPSLSPFPHFLLPGTKSQTNFLCPHPCLRVCFVGKTQTEMASRSGFCPE